jgi:hypothetical protein
MPDIPISSLATAFLALYRFYSSGPLPRRASLTRLLSEQEWGGRLVTATAMNGTWALPAWLVYARGLYNTYR